MKKDKRKMILEAASDCFAKYGYKKTTMDDISKIVGFRTASIYYYFKSKAELYITLVTNEYRSLITKLYEGIDEDMKCEEKILTYFENRLQWLHEQSNILTQITQEELNLFNELGTDIVKEINLEERKTFTNILKGCIEKNEIEKINIEKVSNYIFILTDGIYHNYR
ncbi:MAG: TetR/AcrR family transcriptional regulator, partial [Candidatus Thorarchaeota archaeon]